MNITAFLIVCPLAMLAGFIDSVAGGGGLISLPAYLAAGLPPHLASGSNKLSAAIGSLFANAAYAKSKATAWRPALLGVVGALPGAALGAQLLLLVTVDIIRPLLIVALPVIGVLVLRSKDDGEREAKGWRATRWAAFAVPLLTGLIVGMYDGFFGPGTGTFLALILHGLMCLSWVSATATAKMINLASNIASLCVFIINGQVAFGLALCASLFSIAGNLLGARLAIKRGGKAVRIMMIVALSLLLIRVVADLVIGS